MEKGIFTNQKLKLTLRKFQNYANVEEERETEEGSSCNTEG